MDKYLGGHTPLEHFCTIGKGFEVFKQNESGSTLSGNSESLQ